MSQSSRGGGCGDGGWRHQGCRRSTTAEGAGGPGGGRARMRHMPAPARAQQVPGRSSTPGITRHLKGYGRTGQGPPRWRRRTWLDGAPARRDMTRRVRQWGRTRRGLTPDIQICRSQGIQTRATAYKRDSNGCCLARANTEPRLCVLVSCVFESGPSCTCRLTG